MKVKITHPVSFTNRIIEAGETIDAPKAIALHWIVKEWATKVVEVKVDNRKNNK